MSRRSKPKSDPFRYFNSSPEVIRLVVIMYVRFPLSLRNVEDRFRHWRWHLDEVFVRINGERHYLWCAVDHEGEILESFVTKKRNKTAALKFLKKALKRHGPAEVIVTDGLRSYPAAMRELGNLDRREMGRWMNNRVENSHLPFRRRERAMLRFRQMKTLQKFASVHASVHNHFNHERHLVDRQTYKTRRVVALAEWQSLAA
jgi:putative transposase